ncbi:MAG: hypothetical protein AAF927_09945 [Bacteroidota bacterium]
MRYVRIVGLLFGLICSTGLIWAQNSLPATDTLSGPATDTLRLAHGFVVPNSETLLDKEQQSVNNALYQINYAQGWVLLKDTLFRFPLSITYRYFANPLSPTVAIRQIRITRDTATQEEQIDVIFDERYDQNPREFLASDRIRKSGSLTRGLAVGNRQSLAVTSGLRLQLEGDLGDGLKIVGAITDENIPIQPDGTTQQISDFDRVFIKLMKDRFSLTMGDYEVSQKNTRFGDFYRNVQGVQFAWANDQTKASVSGAVAKGKFHTNTLQAIDGVAGPYRLSGQNNERFFIVLAGSEKVYLNGKLMTRGINQDYIINYNTAEVTFMPKHVITNITRIVVDFEYSDQYYNRSLLVAQMEHRMFDDNLQLNVSYARDADNANAPFDNQTAFQNALDTLSRVGDNTGQAITSGIDSLGAQDNRPVYARVDTLVGGVLYERYVFVGDSARIKFPDSTFYAISATRVGANQGFYEIDPRRQGATVFRWVAPDSLGVPQGDYAPVRQWVLPRLLQVINTRVNYQINAHTRIYSETGLSIEDKNRLSGLGDEDNLGLAQRSGLKVDNLPISDSLQLNVDAWHQYVAQSFQNIDRIYQAEYNRIWDISEEEERTDEQIVGAKIALRYKPGLRFAAEGGYRNTGQGNNAYRQVYRMESSLDRSVQGFYEFTHIKNENQSLLRSSRWIRQEGNIFVPIGKFLQLGNVLWLEDKQIQSIDTTSRPSFSFVDLKPYLRTVNSKKLQLDISWNYRLDREAIDGQLRDKTLAYTWYANAVWNPLQSFNLQTTTAYRTLEVLDTVFFKTGLQDSRVLNTNFQSTFRPKNRLIYANFVYDVSSEQVAQQEVFFIEVNPGQGNYVWLDSLFNNDGIQDFEEFQLATIPEIANFIRVIRPTRELFPTTRLSLNGILRWDFRNVIPDSGSVPLKILRNLNAVTTVKAIQHKSRNTELASYFLRLSDPFADTSLLNANMTLQQDLNFFQKNPTGDLRFSWFRNQSKLFLNTGDEFRGLTFWRAAQRLNLNESRSIELETRIGTRQLSSAGFPQRNYNIQFWETNPQLNFQFGTKVRFSAGYQYQSRQNTNLDGLVDSRLRAHKLIFDSSWNLKDRNNLFAKLELASLNEEGSTTSAAEYELREGLQPGLNAVWRLNLVWFVLSNVEMSLIYDGRISQKTSPLHSGRIQLRAFF